MRSLEELLSELQVESATDVRAWKEPAWGVSGTMEAARAQAEARRNLWVARSKHIGLSIGREEYDLLKQAGARIHGERVIENWLFAVLSPQIDHCAYEQELLPHTLTFRPHTRSFERLKPLRQALLPDGREAFDDIRGEVPEYDKAVAFHDDALKELHEGAVALFDALVQAPDFVAEVERLREGSSPASQDDVGYVASYVVNDIGTLSAENSVLASVWNRGIGQFKSRAPKALVAVLHDARGRFVETVAEAGQRLLSLRKEWSRVYDIPLTRSRRDLEAPAD